MNLNEVRRLLSDLEKLVGGWNSVSEISAIERDVALGKLTAIYDAVRFDAAVETAPAEEIPTDAEVIPVPIDLGDLLAPGHSVGALLSADSAAEETNALSEIPVVESSDPATVSAQTESSPEIASEPAIVVSVVPEEIPSVPEIPAVEEKCATPPAPEVSQTQEQEPSRPYAAPTLFGPEEAFVRHRHKQRVIMSLYDNDPAASRFGSRPKPATKPASAAQAPEPSAPAPVVTASEPDAAVSAPTAPEPIPEPVSAEELATAQSLATAALAEEIPQPESSVAKIEEPAELTAEPNSAIPEAPFAPMEPNSAEAQDCIPAEEPASAAERPAEEITELSAVKEHAPESVFERLAAAVAEAKNPAASPTDDRVAGYSDDESPATIAASIESDEASAQPEAPFAELAPESNEAEDNEEPEPFEVIRTEPEIPAEPESRTPVQHEPEIPAVSEARPTIQLEAAAEARKEHPAGAVLGEVMNHDVRTIADTIAPARDIASALSHGSRVTELRRAIGLNDKFLLIRDLFGGNAAAYEQAVSELDAFDDFDDCMIHIAEHYAWNPDSDGARLLMELLERKFV